VLQDGEIAIAGYLAPPEGIDLMRGPDSKIIGMRHHDHLAGGLADDANALYRNPGSPAVRPQLPARRQDIPAAWAADW
jgi:hypothetical protein